MQTWFSAKIRRLCFVVGQGCTMANDSIFVFRASSFEAAMDRALELGREQEEQYQNGDGDTVKWRFERILTLDIIKAESLDGAEVHTSFEEHVPARPSDEDAELHPELSTPVQTI